MSDLVHDVEFQISLPKFKNSLLSLIILPIWKTKSPFLSSGMYHMSDYPGPVVQSIISLTTSLRR